MEANLPLAQVRYCEVASLGVKYTSYYVCVSQSSLWDVTLLPNLLAQPQPERPSSNPDRVSGCVVSGGSAVIFFIVTECIAWHSQTDWRIAQEAGTLDGTSARRLQALRAKATHSALKAQAFFMLSSTTSAQNALLLQFCSQLSLTRNDSAMRVCNPRLLLNAATISHPRPVVSAHQFCPFIFTSNRTRPTSYS